MSVMKIERHKDIEINNEDIDWVETIMGGALHFNDTRRTIIKNMDSIDIQAFPGSGKTTALVAKLAILAKKWTFSNSGICVLSHTNVAREEIENRLGNTEVGKKLLSYPHFIGTLHSFFDTYIALPWLRSKGIKLNLIDTLLVQKSRWYTLPRDTRIYLMRQNRDESICEYKGSIGTIDWDKQGDTRSRLLSVIQQSQNAGDFTFDEMLLYTQEALAQCSFLPTAIQNRFPIFFIDEAQDTNTFQWDLVHRAFSSDGELSIRQGFGDSNQAIYNYVDETVECLEFPRNNPLLLSESRRFDSRIAELANTVAISSDQMDGTVNEFSERVCCHTIYLFAKEKAGQVIDEFGHLVLDTFSDEELVLYKKAGCHVIGMVHIKKDETPDKQFPKGIYDYWPGYEAKKSNKYVTPQLLVEYFRMGKSEFIEKNETACQVEWIVKGLRQLINKARNENSIAATNNTFSTIIKILSEENKMIFRKLIANLMARDISSKDNWEHLSKHFQRILELFGTTFNDKTNKFLLWADDEAINDPGCIPSDITHVNCHTYQNEGTGRCVELEFGSIHSVKGRTHLATLVLETYFRTHNIKSIIKYLCNTPPKSSTKNQNRLKCQYVAMTRAMGLLCLAIPKEFVDEKTHGELQNVGWHLQVIE